MRKFLIIAVILITAAFYLVLAWDIRPEVEKQQQAKQSTVTVHVENTKDYAEVFRAMRKRW